jgi:hypothetical protein
MSGLSWFAPSGVSLRIKVFVGCVALLAGCGGSQTASRDATKERIEAASARLQGTWTLVQFQPELALEPMLAQLLAIQIGRLTVRFAGNQAFITGVGVNTQRTYRIDNAEFDWLRLTLIEDSGASYQSFGQFAGNDLNFRSDTSPWRGQGMLRRTPTGAP